MYGENIKGKGVGKTIGFPTANLKMFDDKQIMQITRVFLDWLYDLPDDYTPTQQIKFFK